jgi:hypothetical protein
MDSSSSAPLIVQQAFGIFLESLLKIQHISTVCSTVLLCVIFCVRGPSLFSPPLKTNRTLSQRSLKGVVRAIQLPLRESSY